MVKAGLDAGNTVVMTTRVENESSELTVYHEGSAIKRNLVGDNVWIGANVTVLSGVTSGSNTVIGAGSVVNRDIPEGVVAAGNPCRVIRKLTQADRDKYRHGQIHHN